MKIKCRPCFALMAWLLAAPAVLSMDAAQERSERERIRAEQAHVEAGFAERERACRERFVVTSCVEAARSERRQALEGLRRQLEVLDAAERKQRAAERAEQIQSKIRGDDTRRREAVVRERRKKEPRAELPDRSLPGTAAESTAAPAPAASGSMAGDEQRRADYERRLQKAREHKEQVQRRQAERAASGKPPALALPVPASVPAPAR